MVSSGLPMFANEPPSHPEACRVSGPAKDAGHEGTPQNRYGGEGWGGGGGGVGGGGGEKGGGRGGGREGRFLA